MALEEIKSDRLKKLERYEASGLDPYPATVGRTHTIGEVRKKFASLLKSKQSMTLVGRVKAWREHGGATFGDLEDGTGVFQIYLSKEDLRSSYALALETVDIGDFLEVTGIPFETKRGEPTISAKAWKIIAKSLLPLPEKWHGLKDVEERFRKRYLDTLMNPEVRDRFLLRSKVIRLIRDFFDAEGFIEVETPVLQDVPGGALARPFKTHHNAMDLDVYLRIAPELFLKKLLVGGFEKIYELGKSFRNEGIDVTHNPEFTTIEWYAAYWDEKDMMSFVERWFQDLIKTLKIKSLKFDGKEISIDKKFPRLSFADALKRYALIVDYGKETAASLGERAKQFGISPVGHESKGKLADEIFKKVCRPHLSNPTFITDHPLDISPLAKKVPGEDDRVRRFQLVVGGLEIVNAFAELNDSRDQRARFEEQARQKEKGDEESHPIDESFVEALEYGMPPAAGAGIGIDRLVMLLSDVKNIREVVLFPMLKPRRADHE